MKANLLVTVLASLISFSATAITTTPPTECATASTTMTFKGEEAIKEVLANKVTATLRKGVRCFKTGETLTLVESDTKKEFGKVTVSSVEFLTFNEITDVMAKQQGSTVAETQAKLVQIYGEAVKKETLTNINFTVTTATK